MLKLLKAEFDVGRGCVTVLYECMVGRSSLAHMLNACTDSSVQYVTMNLVHVFKPAQGSSGLSSVGLSKAAYVSCGT